jgi:hypothetical protein
MNERTLARFFSKVNKNGPVPAKRPDLGPCWLWKPVTASGGYGQFTANGKTRLAHRAAYELLVGPIPQGLTIDHLCSVRHCVNPAHLEAVTLAENIRRARVWENGAAHQRNKTHCPYGHPYSGDNLRIASDGKRACRECDKRYSANHRERKRAANPPRLKPLREFCVNGHSLTEYGVVRGGRTECRECSRAKVRRYRERQSAQKPPRQSRETCKNGHPWTEANTYVTPSTGRRACSCMPQRAHPRRLLRRQGGAAAEAAARCLLARSSVDTGERLRHPGGTREMPRVRTGPKPAI